jgi:hypothetical protein
MIPNLLSVWAGREESGRFSCSKKIVYKDHSTKQITPVVENRVIMFCSKRVSSTSHFSSGRSYSKKKTA